jgi:hypothetical protein
MLVDDGAYSVCTIENPWSVSARDFMVVEKDPDLSRGERAGNAAAGEAAVRVR